MSTHLVCALSRRVRSLWWRFFHRGYGSFRIAHSRSSKILPRLASPSLRCLSMGLALGFLVLAAQPVVVGATLYYTTGSATASLDTLGSIGTDGSSQSTLASGSGNFTQPIGIAVDGLNSQIYVGDTVAPAILRYDLNGNNRTVILSSPAGNVNGLALDVANQKIYYTTGSGTASLDTLAVVNYNGSGQITLASGTGGAGSHSGTAFGNPQGIALDLVNQKIYVADGATQAGGGRAARSGG